MMLLSLLVHFVVAGIRVGYPSCVVSAWVLCVTVFNLIWCSSCHASVTSLRGHGVEPQHLHVLLCQVVSSRHVEFQQGQNTQPTSHRSTTVALRLIVIAVLLTQTLFLCLGPWKTSNPWWDRAATQIGWQTGVQRPKALLLASFGVD